MHRLAPCLCVCRYCLKGKKTFKKKISVMKRTDILEPNKIKSGYYNNWVVFAWLLSGISFVFVIFMTSFFHIFFVVAVLFERRNLFYTCAKLCSQRQLRGLVDGCDHFKAIILISWGRRVLYNDIENNHILKVKYLNISLL